MKAQRKSQGLVSQTQQEVNENSSVEELWKELLFQKKQLSDQILINEQFIESSYDGFWDWHINDDYEYMSPRLWEMFGYAPEEKEHHPDAWRDMIFEEDLKVALDNFAKHAATKGKHPYRQEVRYRHKDGSTVYVKCRGQVIEWDEEGNPVRMIGTHTDITSLKESEKKLQEAVAALERSNQALHDFAYIASHDLKSPLRGIYTNCAFINEDYQDQLPEEVQSRIDRVERLSKRMETLVDDVLHYSTIGQEKEVAEDLIVRDVVLSLLEILPDKDQENTQVHVSKSIPKVFYNKGHLSEILLNLITNGLKYNDKDKKIIEVGYMEHSETEIALYVRDNGIGIEKDFQDEVFTMFKRLHGKDDYGGGSGAGLAFVKKLVEGNGGKIWIESQPHQGSTIYFTLEKKESHGT